MARELITSDQVTYNLQRMRKQAGYSLTEVGEALGMSRQAVSVKEHNPLSMSVRNLAKFAELYGCKMSDFFRP